MNLAVITLGGFGSYLLARRSLKPIEAAHEAQSRFASDASHELRTPLAIMKSEIQVAMRDTSLDSKDYKELLQSNLEEVDKLTDLSQSLLQLSRLDYGELERSERVDIVKTVKKAAKSLKIPTDRLRYSLPDSTITIDGNESTLGDLFRILLDNAVKYSPEGTPIGVSLTSNGRTCKVTVSNEGEGINSKDLARIFDRFYRTEKSRGSANAAGYGLGLSLAKEIVNLHDGSISATSTPGKITSFTVALPQVRKNR